MVPDGHVLQLVPKPLLLKQLLNGLEEPQNAKALRGISHGCLIEAGVTETLKRDQQAVVRVQPLEPLVLRQDLPGRPERTGASRRRIWELTGHGRAALSRMTQDT